MKFTVFYVIAALAAFALASPVPVAEERAVRVADADLLAREPAPVAEPEVVDVKPRICRRWVSCT